jgi:hypothetical protein
MTLITSGKMLEPESTRTCFLYDPSDGRIVHQHEVINFPGARQVEDKEVESTTLRLAGKLGYDTSKLLTLHLSGALPGDKLYKVDTKSRTLVEITRPSRPRPKKDLSKKSRELRPRSTAKRGRR